MQELIETLRLNHVELQHQNLELRIKENELEASRNKYVHFFDFAPIPYLVLGVAGLIQEVNLSASSMLRVDRKKLIGKSFVSYLSAADQSAFLSFLKSVFT
ncbi:MAG: PAS domain-containing protein, partial [bacterium]